MNEKELNELMLEANEKFGIMVEYNLTIEELSELIKAITKHIRHKLLYPFTFNHDLINNIVEEIVDVEIMLKQLKISIIKETSALNFEMLHKNYEENKIERFKERVKNNWKK